MIEKLITRNGSGIAYSLEEGASRNHKHRERFNNDFEYLLSVLGFAAGFGSVWRFPYLVFKNGGGVFLIPYFILLFAIGIPAFYFETSLGQIFQRGPPKIFEKVHMKWKGLGLFPVFVNLTMSTYYNLILAYSLYFLMSSFTYPLPWIVSEEAETAQPWNSNVLNSSSGLGEIGHVVWPIFICYAVSQVIVFLCIQNGVSVSGKISVFTATSPYVLLLLLMLRGLFLDGSMQGLKFLFSPDWTKILNLSVWVDAANQVVFQVSAGSSVMVFFGSYRSPKEEIKKTCIIMPLLTVACGLLAAIVIFCYMGHMSVISGIPINEIPLAGPDLAFIVFPAVLTKMPLSNILSIAFFLTMVFLGIDTQFAFMDSLAGAVQDEFNGGPVIIFGRELSMRQVRMFVCGVIGVSGLLYSTQAGFYYLGFIDSYGIGINLMATVFMEVGFFMWQKHWANHERNIIANIGEATPCIIINLLKYSVPFITGTLCLAALVMQVYEISNQRWWVSLIGWTFTLYPYLTIFHYYQKYASMPSPKISLLRLQSNFSQGGFLPEIQEDPSEELTEL